MLNLVFESSILLLVMNKFMLVLLVVGCIYVLGPSPSTPNFNDSLPPILDSGKELSAYVQENEAKQNVKPDNEARVIWNDSTKKNRTKYAVIYLHGFSASQEEGDPVHINYAKSIGANLYLARLSEHGLVSEEPLKNMTATSIWESAKEAYAIGKKLGEQVIIMGTSNGGTMALMLASQQYAEIAGLILLSPNIRINNPSSILLDKPWGLFIARAVKGSLYNSVKNATPLHQKYWNTSYRLEALVEVQKTLDESMIRDVFSKVNQPVLVLYYYKDDLHQDQTVKVSAILKMYQELGTIKNNKKIVAIPNAGDHVIGSYITSKDIPEVEKQIRLFSNQMKWNISSDSTIKSNKKLENSGEKKSPEWILTSPNNVNKTLALHRNTLVPALQNF